MKSLKFILNITHDNKHMQSLEDSAWSGNANKSS